MKKSLKAALLSGLVFPGLGQFWLKHAWRGIAQLLAASASLAVIVTKVAQQAFAILEKVESEGGAVDLVAIVNAAHATSTDNVVIWWATVAMFVSWLVSVIDAYLLGSKEDQRRKA
jgi:hypothetical protein